MIVDTSAIMAIILDEPEAGAFLAIIDAAERPRMSAGSWVELNIVLSRRSVPAVVEKAAAILDLLAIEVEPVTVEQAAIGVEGYRRYGRAARHPADLNFGD